MKIAYLINQYPKVSHSFIRRELRALEHQGFEIERYALRGWDVELPDPEDQREQACTHYLLRHGVGKLLGAAALEALNNPSRFTQAAALTWRQWRRGDRGLARNLITLAEACLLRHWQVRDGVEHVHAHFGTNGTQIARLAKVLGGVPFSFTAHGQDEWDAPVQLDLRGKLHDASFAVGISSYSAAQLRRWADRGDWPRIHVLHCGVEARYLEEPLTPVPDVARLVCVGRLCAEKAQVQLLEAVARLVAEGDELELVLAGDGEMRAEVETHIDRLGLRKRVRVTGWISGDQVRAELLGARALVLASFSEGLPVVIMEALALGRPVLATMVGGIPELVRPGKEGWLVPAGDITGLCKGLRTVLRTPVERLGAMGESGRSRVAARHGIERIAARLGRLIHGGRGGHRQVGPPKPPERTAGSARPAPGARFGGLHQAHDRSATAHAQ